jgi:two-component system chemotaxis response regulator CheB
MAQLDLIVIGASAGGLAALEEIISNLPASLPASILIVIHTRSEGESFLPRILSRPGGLPVSFAVDSVPLRRGHAYVAPADRHLLVARRGMVLNRGPRENLFRPAIDPLFRSAARVYGDRVMGIILSGALDDGTHGLQVLKEAGGIAVVQHPEEATFPSMPLSAIRGVAVDYVLRAEDIAALIVEKAGEGRQGGDVMAKDQEPDPQTVETDVQDMEEEFGPPSGLTCPDCGGALWEIKDGKLLRYRCHVGHQYTEDGLDNAQTEVVEGALWSAVRLLEEHADLRRRMARRAAERGMDVLAAGFTETASDWHKQAHTIRELLFGRAVPAPLAPGQARPAAKKTAKTVKAVKAVNKGKMRRRSA